VTATWKRCVLCEDVFLSSRSLCGDCRLHTWCGLAVAALILGALTVAAIRSWWPL
jgi:hypothetical protein